MRYVRYEITLLVTKSGHRKRTEEYERKKNVFKARKKYGFKKNASECFAVYLKFCTS